MKKIICVLLVCVFVFSMVSCGNKTQQYTTKLYFVNTDSTQLVTETRDINVGDDELIAMQVIKALVEGPQNPEYSAIIPKGTKINSVSVNEDLVVVDFSDDICLDNDADMLLLNISVLRTLCEIDGINRVLITVNGNNYVNSQGNTIGIMNKNDIVYDTTSEIKQQQLITLYFANADGSYLKGELRRLSLNEKESIELQVLKELMKGPATNGNSRTIPSETKILSVETKDGVCFVNLSQEFVSRHTGGTASEQLTIYSIVNTLTELDEVEKVQFLIEGQKNESFIHMLINEPFVRDESLIE